MDCGIAGGLVMCKRRRPSWRPSRLVWVRVRARVRARARARVIGLVSLELGYKGHTGLGLGLFPCRNCSEVEGDAARDRLRGIEAGDADLARVRARIRLGSGSG